MPNLKHEHFLKTMREWLMNDESQLDEDPPSVGNDIWDILTALRGPDRIIGGFDEVKAATTSVLRWFVLGGHERIPKEKWFYTISQGPREFYAQRSLMNCDCEKFAKIRRDLWEARVRETDEGGHFIIHAKRAFEALGLDWYKVNE